MSARTARRMLAATAVGSLLTLAAAGWAFYRVASSRWFPW